MLHVCSVSTIENIYEQPSISLSGTFENPTCPFPYFSDAALFVKHKFTREFTCVLLSLMMHGSLFLVAQFLMLLTSPCLLTNLACFGIDMFHLFSRFCQLLNFDTLGSSRHVQCVVHDCNITSRCGQ